MMRNTGPDERLDLFTKQCWCFYLRLNSAIYLKLDTVKSGVAAGKVLFYLCLVNLSFGSYKNNWQLGLIIEYKSEDCPYYGQASN